MKTYWIGTGKVTCLDAHPTAKIGDTEWQFSDGPAGSRSMSFDYLSLEAGLKNLGPAVFHFEEA